MSNRRFTSATEARRMVNYWQDRRELALFSGSMADLAECRRKLIEWKDTLARNEAREPAPMPVVPGMPGTL
jgi:hypothetical protein